MRSPPDQEAKVRRVDTSRITVLLIVASLTLALSGCGGGHPRTEVLRSANPLTSDIYLRITGPGGAVSYVARRFMTGGEFSRFSFTEDRRRGQGLFLPPRVRERKLCASTHVIRSADAPELQRWRGRTVAITVYGNKISAIYCAVLGPNNYETGS